MEEAFKGMGLHFTFGPEFFTIVAEDGQDYQGEYGSYKYLPSQKELEADQTAEQKASKSAAVCLISDKLLPVGTAQCVKVDGVYSICYNKFRLNLPWKQKGEDLTFHQGWLDSREYLKIAVLDTKNLAEVDALMQKAIQNIIASTEQELRAIAEQS